MMAMQVLNTRGAARRLGCSQTWIHKLVAAGKLKAYTYDENGVLVETSSNLWANPIASAIVSNKQSSPVRRKLGELATEKVG